MSHVIPPASPRAATSSDPIAHPAAHEACLPALSFIRQPGRSPNKVAAVAAQANAGAAP